MAVTITLLFIIINDPGPRPAMEMINVDRRLTLRNSLRIIPIERGPRLFKPVERTGTSIRAGTFYQAAVRRQTGSSAISGAGSAFRVFET